MIILPLLLSDSDVMNWSGKDCEVEYYVITCDGEAIHQAEVGLSRKTSHIVHSFSVVTLSTGNGVPLPTGTVYFQSFLTAGNLKDLYGFVQPM